MEQLEVMPAGRTHWQTRPLVFAATALLWLGLLATVGSPDLLAWAAQTLPNLLLVLVASALLYVVPGLALLQLLRVTIARDWAEKLALAVGIGIALPPLLLELAHLVWLPWSRWTTLGYILLSLLVLVVSTHRRPDKLEAIRPSRWTWHSVLLSGLLTAALAVRFYITRDLPVGLWGDSYQHTMMAQLLVDHGGLFQSWEPYAPLATFTYHYGFHANVAFFHWLTGVPVTESVLLVGQLHSTAALTSAYLLTTWLSKNRHAGLWAVALTGFLNTQPFYYVNWGRYTQLTGQVILPALLVLWMAMLERKRWSWRLIALTATVTACLMLTHYIVTIFAALCLGAYVVLLIVRRPQRELLLSVIGRSATAALFAILLTGPWLINTLQGYLGRNVAGFVDQRVGADRLAELSVLTSVIPFYLKAVVVGLAAVGLLVALVRRDWRVALCAIWTLLLIFAVVPHIVGLPGTGVVTSFAAYIALYLTAIPLAAYALGFAHALLLSSQPGLTTGAVVVAVLTLTVWGIRWQQHVIDPKFQLFTPADAAAMAWIREHTPADATFLVNMFPAYGGTLFAGSDGGWWIPLLTKRQTTLPPLTYGSERGAQPDYAQRVNELGYALRDDPLPSDKAIAVIRDAGIDYIYSGAHSQQADKLNVSALRNHPAFRVVYEQGGVTILAVEPP